MQSLGEHPISGELLAQVTPPNLQSSLSAAKMKGTPPPQQCAFAISPGSSERCRQVSFCVTGQSRAPGSDGSGKATSAMVNQREEEGLDMARWGCRAVMNRGIHMSDTCVKTTHSFLRPP